MSEIEIISGELTSGIVNKWDTSTGKITATINEHTDTINGVCSSNDGTKYATCSYDKTARIYDRKTNKIILVLEGHIRHVYSICFSKDDIYILTCSSDKTSRLWLTETGECIQVLKGHTSFVNSGTFSPDNKLIVTGSWDKTIRIWNVESGECIKTIEKHTDWVGSVSFSPNSKQIASGSHDKTCRLFDVESGNEIQIFNGHAYAVRSVCYLPDGNHIATGSDDKTIRLWDIKTGKEIMKFDSHSEAVNSIDISSDGLQILSASGDKTIRLWDIQSGKCLQVLKGHENYVWAVCFLRNPSSTGSKSISNVINKNDEIDDEDETNIVELMLSKTALVKSDQIKYATILLEGGYNSIPLLQKLNETKLTKLKITLEPHIETILETISTFDLNSTLASMKIEESKIEQHLFFISYVKVDTLSDTKLLFDFACKKYGDKISIFQDTNERFKLDELVKHVRASKNVVIFLSQNYTSSPYCLVELVESMKVKANIVTVLVHKPGLTLFDFKSINESLKSSNIKLFLNESGWNTLNDQGISESDVISALKAVVNVKAFDLHMNSSAKVIQVEMEEILDGLKM